MKRSILVALAIVTLASASFADVTMKSTVTGQGMGMGGTVNSTTFIKGAKMRTDTAIGDTVRTSIIDIDTMKMYSFDSKKKEADVFDISKLAGDIGQRVQVNDIKASVKANGKTKDLAGKNASGYDMEVVVPAMMGGKDGVKVDVNLAGPVWIVKDGPGTAEYLAFYKKAVEKGWFFGDPRTAKGQPGQAMAMGEMYRQLAATGGIPYEHQISVKMTAEGAMAGAIEKMGNISMSTVVTSVEAGTLAEDLFAVPAGYTLKDQK